MRNVRWTQPAGDEPAVAELGKAVARQRASRAVLKGFAAFLLGLTLGVTVIIFAQTAVVHTPGAEPEAIWSDPPRLRQ